MKKYIKNTLLAAAAVMLFAAMALAGEPKELAKVRAIRAEVDTLLSSGQARMAAVSVPLYSPANAAIKITAIKFYFTEKAELKKNVAVSKRTLRKVVVTLSDRAAETDEYYFDDKGALVSFSSVSAPAENTGGERVEMKYCFGGSKLVSKLLSAAKVTRPAADKNARPQKVEKYANFTQDMKKTAGRILKKKDRLQGIFNKICEISKPI